MILYLGLDPSRYPYRGKLLHYPVIRTEKIVSAELHQAHLLWPQFTHVIFTSQTAVQYWTFRGPQITIAIGKTTAQTLNHPLIAPTATQEGVIALLETLDLKDAYIFIPRSKQSRSQLTQYLIEKRIRFFALDLYDTFPQKPLPIPNLDEIDEIVFTSPSTVQAFLQIYECLPKNKKLTAIGPVTQKALEENALISHTHLQ